MTGQTARQVRVHAIGGVENLKLDERTLSAPGPGRNIA